MPLRFHFTKKELLGIEPPAHGRLRVYDDEVRGFGLVIAAGGSRRFFLRRMVRYREHVIDLGSFPETDVQSARQAARDARADLEDGPASLARRSTLKAAWNAFITQRIPSLRPSSQREYIRLWTNHLSALGRYTLCDVDRKTVAKLHGDIGARCGPYTANKVQAVLSSILHHAVDVGLIASVPPLPRRYRETRRQRWLDRQELRRLLEVLYSSDDIEARLTVEASIAGHRFTPVTSAQKAYFLLLLFTGARRSEVAAMRWDQIDLERGVWIRIQKGGLLAPTVLATPAIEVLEGLLPHRDDHAPSPWVFPGHGSSGHLEEPKGPWARVCARAQIDNARIHDLRHTHASWLAQAGVSLQIIGGQLGHRQTATTERYAHLTLDPVRRAVEDVVAEMKR